MKETKFTPGPWIAKDVSGAGLEIYADLTKALGEKCSNDFPIFGNRSLRAPQVQIAYETWLQFPTEEWEAMQKANAHLIAAAPELFDALEATLTEYVELVESADPVNWDAEKEPHVIAARAVLKKARGEA